MAGLHDSVDLGDNSVPGAALSLEELAPRRRKPVTAAAAFAVFLQPAAGDETAVLQPEQNRVQRPDAEADLAVGTFFNQLADIVSMAWPAFEQNENQQFGAALVQVAIE